MSEALNWNDVRDLARRVSEGETFSLTDEVRAILRRTAPQVAIPPDAAEQALQQEASAAALLDEIARRIRDGSRRLSRTLAGVDRLQSAGDVEGARKLLREVLAVEVVPHYRRITQTHLDALDDEP
ncbi:DUSAM domain-containing protein [Pyxidicoccus caerfyrddinensis]|uniref:DUSAM domain-containing protein n=1 Tax=Pyxidicoccus caerfyrddinensis TaxID=2709663 RepID=UPI0013DADD32|nr:DUSAM domain-containing protein [Pyxidicoccus caerfyrddinensis]